MHAKATLDGSVLAETEQFEFVEGNVYFPPDSIINKFDTLTPASHTTQCPWKGEAHYYDVHTASGKVIKNGAWYYPQPLEKAVNLKSHVAFDKRQVQIEKDDGDGANENGDEGGMHHGLKDKMKMWLHK